MVRSKVGITSCGQCKLIAPGSLAISGGQGELLRVSETHKDIIAISETITVPFTFPPDNVCFSSHSAVSDIPHDLQDLI